MDETKRIPNEEVAPAASLAHVLDKSEQITGVVEQCAQELSLVNSTLNDQLRREGVHPGIVGAIKKSEGIENKIQDAAEDLSAVNRALEAEIKVRGTLEDQLNATQEQADADRHAAFHDPLTSLPNRALFNDRLEHGLAQARRHGWMLAVMFIDLDDFKNINDTHGHAAGDQVLQAIANRLKGAMRADDTVSRHGGDEFLYLLLELKQEADAASVAKKIIKMLSEPCHLTVDGIVISAIVRPSIGIAIFPLDGQSSDALIESADSAMYRSKSLRLGQSTAIRSVDG
ncbi:MAG: GGDEF domain-containing protein [Pseudomonadota bacterium]|nr:GGDEF domain-containing protein [Pseudomonadota bacterium]